MPPVSLRVSTALTLTIAAVLATVSIAHSGEEKDLGITIEPSRSMYAPGDAAEITVTNRRAASIFLAGCGSFQVELFVAEHYTALPGDHCVSEGEAIEIPPGTHTLTYRPGVDRSGDILRVAVPFGWGCEAGRELSQARCKDFATAWSGSFRVSRKGK